MATLRLTFGHGTGKVCVDQEGWRKDSALRAAVAETCWRSVPPPAPTIEQQLADIRAETKQVREATERWLRKGKRDG